MFRGLLSDSSFPCIQFAPPPSQLKKHTKTNSTAAGQRRKPFQNDMRSKSQLRSCQTQVESTPSSPLSLCSLYCGNKDKKSGKQHFEIQLKKNKTQHCSATCRPGIYITPLLSQNITILMLEKTFFFFFFYCFHACVHEASVNHLSYNLLFSSCTLSHLSSIAFIVPVFYSATDGHTDSPISAKIVSRSSSRYKEPVNNCCRCRCSERI